MGVIKEGMGHDSVSFGRIEIDRTSSSIDVDVEHAPDVAIALSGLRFGGRKVDVGMGKTRGNDSGRGWKKHDRPGGGYSNPKHKKGKKIKSKRKRI